MTIKASNKENQILHLLALVLFATLLALAFVVLLAVIDQTSLELSTIVDAYASSARTTNYNALPLAV